MILRDNLQAKGLKLNSLGQRPRYGSEQNAG